MMAITVGSREFKNRLGSYLRQVRSGATIVVTDRGSPVAELRPVQPAATEEQEQLDALVASGLLAPRIRTGLAERDPVTAEDVDLSGAIREGREERLYSHSGGVPDSLCSAGDGTEPDFRMNPAAIRSLPE